MISDNHAKSVLVGILDPMTRQHTAMHHGGNTGYEKLKRVVLEFTNNVAGSDSAMQVDQIAETFNEEQGQEHTGADPGRWRIWRSCITYQLCFCGRGRSRPQRTRSTSRFSRRWICAPSFSVALLWCPISGSSLNRNHLASSADWYWTQRSQGPHTAQGKTSASFWPHVPDVVFDALTLGSDGSSIESLGVGCVGRLLDTATQGSPGAPLAWGCFIALMGKLAQAVVARMPSLTTQAWSSQEMFLNGRK